MLAIRASRSSPQVALKANRSAVVSAWEHSTRNSNKIAMQEAALSHRAFSSPPSQSALVAPPCTPLSTGTVRSLHSAAHLVRRKGVAAPWHGHVYSGHDVGRSRVSAVVRMTPRVRTLTSGPVPSIFGSCPSMQATGRSELGGIGAMRRGMSTMSEGEFHAVADEELEEIHDAVEEALEEGFEEDFDCNMAVSRINRPTDHTRDVYVRTSRYYYDVILTVLLRYTRYHTRYEHVQHSTLAPHSLL